jgi:hypothetical protein
MPGLPQEANYGRLSSVRAIIAAGGDVNEIDFEGNTAAHYAAQNFNAVILAALIEANADIIVENKNGDTPLDLAVRALIISEDGVYCDIDQGKEVIELLVRNGADFSFIDTLQEMYSGLDETTARLATIKTWITEALAEDSTATRSSTEEVTDEAVAADEDAEMKGGEGTANDNDGSGISTLSNMNYSQPLVLHVQDTSGKLVDLEVPDFNRNYLDQTPNSERQAYEEALEEIRKQFEEDGFAKVRTEDTNPTLELPTEIFDVQAIIPLTMLAFLAAQGSQYFDSF